MASSNWEIDTTPSTQPLPELVPARRNLHQTPTLTQQQSTPISLTPQAAQGIIVVPELLESVRCYDAPGAFGSRLGPQAGSTYIFKSDNSLPLYGCTTCTTDKVQRAFLTAVPAKQLTDTATFFKVVPVSIQGFFALQVKKSSEQGHGTYHRTRPLLPLINPVFTQCFTRPLGFSLNEPSVLCSLPCRCFRKCTLTVYCPLRPSAIV